MSLDLSVITGNWQLFAQGLMVTLVLCIASLILGSLVAVAFTVLIKSRFAVARWLANALLLLLRGVPFIVIVFVLHFGLLSSGLRPSPFFSGVAALSLFAAAYFAEMLRGALDAIPSKQWESGQMVGFNRLQTLRYIIAPQMIRPSVPAAVNIAIMTIKESSVISAITVGELTYQGLVVQGKTFAPFEVFFATALIYWAITIATAQLGRWVDRRLGQKQGGSSRRSALGAKFLELETRT